MATPSRQRVAYRRKKLEELTGSKVKSRVCGDVVWFNPENSKTSLKDWRVSWYFNSKVYEYKVDVYFGPTRPTMRRRVKNKGSHTVDDMIWRLTEILYMRS